MRIPRFIIPVLVIAAIFGGYFLRTAFTQPTTNKAASGEAGAKSTFIVDGLKCKGTAGFFTSLYDSIPGVAGIETFATEHKAVISYDPDRISVDSIKAIMEAIIVFDDGSSARIFKCQSVE